MYRAFPPSCFVAIHSVSSASVYLALYVSFHFKALHLLNAQNPPSFSTNAGLAHLFSPSPHPWPRWLPARTRRKLVLSEPAMLTLSAKIVLHHLPSLPLPHDIRLGGSRRVIPEALTGVIRRDLRDPTINNLGLLHPSLQTPIQLCLTSRLFVQHVMRSKGRSLWGRVRAKYLQKFDKSRRK